jgi:hypothetical protein
MMVTTLVQVHESQLSKDRRDSTTSTHDSVAISVSSFKSEDTDGWKEIDEEALTGRHHQQHQLPLSSIPAAEPSSIHKTILTSGKPKEYGQNSSSKLPILDKGKFFCYSVGNLIISSHS